MAKETVKVDNNLEEIKLEKNDKMNKKKKENKKENKNKPAKNTGTETKQSYLGKVRKEMKLVTWPTRKQVAKYSFASILMIILLAAFFIGVTALFDLLYSLVQGWIG